MTDNLRIDLEAGLSPGSWARMARAAEAEVRNLKGRLDRVMAGGDMLGGTGSSPHSARPPTYGIQPASRYGGFSGYLGRQLMGRGSAEGATARLVAGVMGFGGGMMSLPGQIIGGVGTARRQEQELSNLNRRVGESIQTYQNFRQEVLATGEALGNTRQQIIQMTNDYVSSVGRMSTMKLSQDLTYGQQLAKGLGVAPELIMGAFGGLGRQMQGPNTSSTLLGSNIAAAIDAGGMRGRESEVVKAIQDLTELMGQRIPTVTPMMFQTMTGLMTAFNASGIQGLSGARGAQLIGGLDSFLQGKGGSLQQNLLFRSLQAQSGGAMNLFQMTKQSELGVGSPQNIAATQMLIRSIAGGMPGALGPGGKPSDALEYILKPILGMTMNQLQDFIPAILGYRAGQDITKIPGLRAGLGADVQLTAQDEATKALTQFQNALLNVATTLQPEVTNALHAVTNVVNGAGGLLQGFMGLANASHLAELGVYAITAAQIAGAAHSGYNFVGGLGQGAKLGPVKKGQSLGTGFSVPAMRGNVIKGGLGIGALMTGINVLGDIASGTDPWRDIGRGVFTTGGTILGGLLGAPLGGVGAFAGGALGGLAGNAAFDWLFPDKGGAASQAALMSASGRNPVDLLASIDRSTQILAGGAGAYGHGATGGAGFGFGPGDIGAGAGITHGLSSIFGRPITQGYGHTMWENFHTGVDLGYGVGSPFSLPFMTKVLAETGKGLGPDIGGNEMLLQGPGGKQILLAHLQKFIAQVGQSVGPGGLLALTGNTGDSSGPHLHLQVMNPGAGSWASRSIDPISYLQNLELHGTLDVRYPDGQSDAIKTIIKSGPYKGVYTKPFAYGSN